MDQERERKKKAEAEELAQKEAAEREEIRKIQERKDRIKKLKIDLVSEIPEEPSSSDDVIRVVIKLPEGQRLERRFKKCDSLKILYYYVFCHPESPDEFDITTNFPRKVLECKPEFINNIIEHSSELRAELEASLNNENIQSFQEAGFVSNTMLFVNDLEA